MKFFNEFIEYLKAIIQQQYRKLVMLIIYVYMCNSLIKFQFLRARRRHRRLTSMIMDVGLVGLCANFVAKALAVISVVDLSAIEQKK